MAKSITKVEWTNQAGTAIYKTFTDIPEPSSYRWGKQDISGQGAGRNIHGDLWKNLVGKTRKLELSWQNQNASVVSKALQIFDHEYVYITYFDALLNGYKRGLFYMGDMGADLYSFSAGKNTTIWSTTTVNCIQSKVDRV